MLRSYNEHETAPETDEPDLDEEFDGPLIPEPPHPINWNLLTSEEAEAEWLELNRCVDWLRRTYALPASASGSTNDPMDASSAATSSVRRSTTTADTSTPTSSRARSAGCGSPASNVQTCGASSTP